MSKSKIQNKSKCQNPNDKTKVLLFVICALSLFCHLCFGICHLSFSQEVKQPNVAGTFYPDNPQELSQVIESFIDNAKPIFGQADIFALILPHAGYGYSGQVAAYGYKLVKDKPYKTVIIIGPSHYYGFSGVSVYAEGLFNTPLGDLEIDREFTQRLLNKDTGVTFEASAFTKEHSVEVQLPFLQKSLSEFKIVPIVMGDSTLSTCQRLAALLKQAIGNRKDVLVIASTDMYHGYDYEEAEKVDDLTLSYLKNMDAEGLYYGLREGKVQLCGGWPVVATIILARQLNHKRLTVLKYTDSAQVTGKKIKGIWTVGYSSSVITQAALEPISKEKEGTGSLTGQEKGEIAMLDKNQRKRLLEIARDSIEIYLKAAKKLEINETDPMLGKEMGAFVTLHKHGQLRGCIGNLTGNQPLYLTIRDMAVEAAVDDPRFAPAELNELKDIEIELSVLSPLELINDITQIKLGTHGVLVKQGSRSGVFLPQVADETNWSREEFLSNLCAHKAGLSPLAWKDKSTEIYIFTAQVFSEKNF